MSVRTIERAVADIRRAQRVAALATVRVETAPGDQLQIDFGQKRLRIAVSASGSFCWSRCSATRAASSSKRFSMSGATTGARASRARSRISAVCPDGPRRQCARIGARPRPRDRHGQFHRTYLAFCRDWDVQPRACAPYRAQTKGKTEAGVKYVKRNALADQGFDSFGALEQHLAEWMTLANQRHHGTTREAPIVRFERDERATPRPPSPWGAIDPVNRRQIPERYAPRHSQ